MRIFCLQEKITASVVRVFVDMFRRYTFGTGPTLKEINTGYKNKL